MIDLGNEPPLSVDGGGGLVDRRRLSVQWFSGTILTGLCGAALMGGAVFASLDGETNFASAPERVESALRGAISSIGDRLNGLRKTDRLPAISEPSVSRTMLRVPTSTHVRDRELVRMRNYVRVTGNLSLTVTDLSANIPPFNPQKLLSDSVAGDDQTPAAEPDAEVTFVTCDLAPAAPRGKVTPAVCDLNSLLPKVKQSTQLPLDAVLTRVRDVASRAGTGPSLTMNADGTPNLKLSYAAEGDTGAFFNFQPRVVPENVTLLPKTTSQINCRGDWSERMIPVKKGETVGSILRELGAAPDEIKSIIAVIGPAALEGGLKEGQKLRVLMTPAGLGHVQPLRVIIAGDSGNHGGGRAVRSRPICAGRYPQYRYRCCRHRRRPDRRRRLRRRAALSEHLRDRAAQQRAELGDRGTGPHLFLRRRFPAQSPARRLDSTCSIRTTRTAKPKGLQKTKCATPSSPSAATPKNTITSRPPTTALRLLRRDRQQRQEIPGAQAGRHRHRDVAVRLAHPSAAPRQRIAFRRRLGRAVRHADFRRRQRRHRGDRAEGRLRQICPHPPRQRLRNRLRPHDRVRPRPRCRQPKCARARSSASSARPACRPARTCISRSSSTTASSIRCGSSCRAAASSTARRSRLSTRTATSSTRARSRRARAVCPGATSSQR